MKFPINLHSMRLILSQAFYGELNPQFLPRENAEHCENVSLKGLKTLKHQLSNDHTLCTKNVHQNRKNPVL